MVDIALDVESVLADTNEAALQATDALDREQLLGEWEFDTRMKQVYMGVSDALWRHEPSAIPPEEPRIGAHVDDIRDKHTVHILTGREHVDANIMWWLREHGVTYESFTSTDKHKGSFDEYDVFIDDNPNMAGSCQRLLIRNQAWNEHIDTDDYLSVDRIHSLAEVLDYV
jgi:hypothetical protein